MPNITNSTISAQQVTALNERVLMYLHDFFLFGGGFFSNADIPTETPAGRIPIYDATSQILKGGSKGETINIPIMGRTFAKDKLPNLPIVNQTQSVTTVSLTLNKHKYVSCLVEDFAKIFDNVNLINNLAKSQAQALAEAFEDDILALFTGFSHSVGSGSGSNLSFDDLATANQILFDNGINPDLDGGAHAILSHYTYRTLSKARDEYQVGGSKGVEGFNKGKILETPHGIHLHRSARVPVASSACKQAVITKDAIMCGFGIRPRTQKEYVITEIGEIILSDVVYGVAELRDEAGVLLNFDDTNGESTI